jgi:peptide-methionine (S)-S-oxide reductase
LAPAKEGVDVPAAKSRAVFAGGCFWCSEADFEKVEGVIDVRSGYTGGPELDPTYEQVSRGATGHTEAIEVVYDPSRVSYQKLLEIFWRSIDPTVKDRQFCDRGSQYRSAIFVSDSTEKKLAESGKAKAASTLRKPVFTEIEMATKFYPAEEYHQDYYLKNPLRYKYYRFNCGRDQRLAELWGEPASK